MLRGGEPKARASGGGGGAAVRTSVAFIHLAAPIRLPVTHPTLRRGAEPRQRAGEDPQLGPLGPLLTHLLGSGVLNDPSPRALAHKRAHTLRPASGTGGQDKGRGRPPQGGPSLSDWHRGSLHLFARVSWSGEGDSGSLPHTTRSGMRGGPPTPGVVPWGQRGRGR